MMRENETEICSACGETFADLDRAQLCDDCGETGQTKYTDYVHGTRSDSGDIFDPIETESLTDCLQDIATGCGFDSLGFWKASDPV